jgi:hypothetical protein
MASQWIANFKRRPGKSALVPLVLLSSGVLASVCADTEYHRAPVELLHRREFQ